MGVFSVRWWLGISIAAAAVGCAADAPETSTSEPQAIVGGNGNWSNGLTTNGLIDNGIWSNGNWSNGNWSNGNWSNGIWSNGAWTQNLDARALLRTNPSTGQLLQYMYSCAMPAGVTKTIDPGVPPAANVVLTGAIGLAPQWDTDGGECDESCQRWISACVLARTNAYGATVEISMRAPANAPLHIRNALATTVDERTNWNKREGAYYGNLFDMTPQCDGVDATDATCSGITTFANTPKLFACVGPISNLPALTKRFSSSQGDNGPIGVVGECLTPANAPKVCTGMDDYAEGALTTCFDKPPTDPNPPFDPNLDRTPYSEVITVYLKDPLNICGNQVCEEGEEGVCASDCRPGAWAKSLPYSSGIAGALYYPFKGTTALGPDDTVVVASSPPTDVTLGNGELLPVSDGSVLVARYTSEGQYIPLSARRFMSQMSNEILDVAADGSVAVAGFQSFEKLFEIGKLNPDGTVAFVRDIGSSGVNANGKIAVDSQGDIIVAAQATDAQVISGSISFPAGPDIDIYVVKLDGATGDPIWAKQFAVPGADLVAGLEVASDDSILLTSTSSSGQFRKLSKTTGDVLWSQTSSLVDVGYTGTATDAAGNVYISGRFRGTHDFGAGVCAGKNAGPTGDSFFLAKYSPDGTICHWVVHTNNICPPDAATCESFYTGGAITFDTAGNVIVGGMLNGTGQDGLFGGPSPYKGAIIDFGAGPFDNYRFQDPVLVSYTPSGSFLWAKQIPAPVYGNFKGLAVNSQNDIVVSGTYSGSIYIDGLFLVNTEPQRDGSINTFIAQTPVPTPDLAPPSISQVEDIVLEATSSEGAVGFYLPPTAIDHASGVASVYCSPRAWSTFPIGTTPVTCHATDPFGNQSSPMSFDVIVVDSAGPALKLPENLAVISAVPIVVDFGATALDLVDGVRPVTCDPAPASVFPLGTTVVTCQASDLHGNTTTGYFNVTVSEHPAPTLTVPSMITAQATGPSGAPVAFTVTAHDYLNQPLTPACSPLSGSTFGFGYTNVHCIATDSFGTLTSADFLVRVIDTTGPVLALANVVVDATNTVGQPVTYVATATDAVDGAVPITCTPASGSVFPVGTTTVSCTAKDSRYNYSTGTFTVTVVYAWSGVLQPINADGSSIFKLGSTVPVKFALTGGSAGITNLVATLTYVKLTNGIPGPVNEATSNSGADTGNTFRYTGQYMFNLSTRTAHGFTSGPGTYRLIFDLGDGLERTVQIALKP